MTVDELRTMLERAAIPADAAPMAAYMKDRFTFLGVKTPARRTASKPLIRESRRLEPDEVITLADELRAQPEREFHYVASDLLRAHDQRLRADHIAAMERFITTDAWWDTVDALASPTVGTMVLNHPALVEVMDDWIGSDDIWLARTAIIHQLRFDELTDEARLFRYADRRAADREFFIRKGIGWALRQHARTNPDAVRAFVDERRDRLSGLTIREATKHL